MSARDRCSKKLEANATSTDAVASAARSVDGAVRTSTPGPAWRRVSGFRSTAIFRPAAMALMNS